MKKIIALLLLIIIFLVTPFAIGKLIAERSQTLAQYYQQNPHIKHIDISVTPGLFHTSITSKLIVHIPALQAEAITLTIHHTLRQGPILWGDNRPIAFGFADMQSKLLLAKDVQQQLNTNLGNLSKLSLLTQLHYNGSQDSSILIPEIIQLSNDDTRIAMHPLHVKMHSSLPANQLQATINWQGIALSQADKKIDVKQSHAHANLQKEQSLWTGNIDWQSQSIQWQQAQENIQLHDIHIQANTHLDAQQRVSSQQHLSIANIVTQGVHYGSATYSLAINNIPLSVLEQLDEIQQNIAKLPANQQQQALAGIPFRMFNVLPDILVSEPEITLHHASLITPQGEIKADVSFALRDLKQQDVMNFTKIKKHIHADISLQLPTALIKQNNTTQINNLLQKGWLIEKNHMLFSTLHMADGILSINQQTIPLPF